MANAFSCSHPGWLQFIGSRKDRGALTDLPKIAFQNFLTTQGLHCPEPLMLIRVALRQMQIDEVLLAHADDPPARTDVPLFCQFIGHILIATHYHLHDSFFFIQKK